MSDALTERREQHEERLPNLQWYSVQDLADRWHLSPTTVRNIPYDELRYKEFGRGVKLKRRKYRADWLVAYEEDTGRQAA